MPSIRTRNGKKGETFQVLWHDPVFKVQRSETFRTKKEAERRLKIVKGLLAEDEVPTSRRSTVTTYGNLCQQWMTHDVERRLTPKVRSNYIILQRGYVLPFWSKVTLDKIDPDRIAEWITWMETKTRSPWTMLEAFSSMSACLTFAVHMQKLRTNPLSGMKRLLPKRPKAKERVLLDPQQIMALSNEVPDRYRALVLLLGAHGLRPSEGLALTIDDVNLTEGWVNIDKAVVNVAGSMILNDETKTGTVRRVDLFPIVQEALIEHVAGFVDDPTDGESLLFPSASKGSYIHTDTLRSIIVKPAAERLGIVGLTTYSLRHSAEVNLVSITRDPRMAMQMLGHTDVAMTMKVYDHVTPGRSAAASALMQQAFGA